MMLHEKKIFLTNYVFNNGANENIKNTSIGISTYQTHYLLSASLLKKFSLPQFHKKIGLMLFGSCINELYTETVIMNNDTSLLLICN